MSLGEEVRAAEKAGVPEREVGVLPGGPAAGGVERDAKDNGALDELSVGLDEGVAEDEGAEEGDGEELDEAGDALDSPEADGDVEPRAELGDVGELDVWGTQSLAEMFSKGGKESSRYQRPPTAVGNLVSEISRGRDEMRTQSHSTEDWI